MKQYSDSEKRLGEKEGRGEERSKEQWKDEG